MFKPLFRNHSSCVAVALCSMFGVALAAGPPTLDDGPAVSTVARKYARPSIDTTWPPTVAGNLRGEDEPAAPVWLSAQTSFDHLRVNPFEDGTIDAAQSQSALGGTLIENFAGMSDTGPIPPDTIGAVGPNHVMSTLNGGVAMLTRTGASAIPQQTLQSFWSALGTGSGSPASALTDPRVLYDQYSDRWVTIVIGNPNNADGTNNSWILIAISQTNDPTMAWNLYAVKVNVTPTHTNHWADFPGLGVDPNNVVVTSNIFSVGGAPAFVHADVWVFDKASLIAGGSGGGGALVQGADYALIHDPCTTGNFTFQPTHTFGQLPAAGQNFIVDQGWLDTATRTRRFAGVKPINGVGAAATVACGADGFSDFIELQQYNFNILGTAQPNCSQTIIAGGDARVQDVVWRNGRLWFTHTVGAGSGVTDSAPATKAEVAWYQLDPTAASTFPGSPPVQQGHVSNFTRAYFFPSIAVNASDCAALGFSGADATTFASAYFTVREAADAPGTMRPVSLLKAGEGHYFKTFGGPRNRWGDYSATVIDPVDDETFWTIQEYAKTPFGSPLACTANSGVWGTWWGAFRCGVVTVLPDPPIAGADTFDRALEVVLASSASRESVSGPGTAYRLTLTSLYHPANPQPTNQPDFTAFEGQVRYLNLLRDGGGNVVTSCVSSPALATTYLCATIGCNPEFADWPTLFGGGTVHVSGNAIIPDSSYTLAHLAASCVGNEATCTDASAEVPFTTARHGNSNPAEDTLINVTDIVNTVDVVKQVIGSAWEYQVYVRNPNPAPQTDATNVTDIVVHVDAVKLVAYALTFNTCP